MEKVKYGLGLLLVFLSLNSHAQEKNKNIIRTGLLSAQMTICPTYMFAGKESYFYLHGGIEGYVSDKLSLTGEGFYNLGSFAETSVFDYNHSVFFGAARHFTKKNSDLYVGIQPGISFTKLNPGANSLVRSHMGVNPLLSPVVGYNFYVNRFFHFFVQTRLVLGQHNTDVHQNISEIRFSAGLGYNINMMK